MLQPYCHVSQHHCRYLPFVCLAQHARPSFVSCSVLAKVPLALVPPPLAQNVEFYMHH